MELSTEAASLATWTVGSLVWVADAAEAWLPGEIVSTEPIEAARAGDAPGLRLSLSLEGAGAATVDVELSGDVALDAAKVLPREPDADDEAAATAEAGSAYSSAGTLVCCTEISATSKE